MAESDNQELIKSITFLEKNWAKLPKNARVVAYFIILFSVLYFIFGNGYIDARLEIDHKGKTYHPQEALVIIDHSGRPLRIRPDNEGYFSFPLPDKYPLSDYPMEIRHDENEPNNSIRSMLSLKHAYEDRVHLVYSRETKALTLETPKAIAFSRMFGISSVYASESSVELYSEQKTVSSLIQAVVSDLSPDYVKGDDPHLRSDLGFTNIELSIVHGELKEKFNLDLWSFLRSDVMLSELNAVANKAYYDDIYNESWLGERLQKSRVVLKEEIKLLSSEDQEEFLEARSLRKIGKHEAALAKFKLLSSNYPDMYLISFNEALSFDAQNDISEAKKHYEKAIGIIDRLEKTDASLWNTYGRFLYRQNLCEESLKWFYAVEAVSPNRKYLDEYIMNANECIETGKAEEVTN